MAAKIFRINYKSDFILTLNSDAGWMTPFCIKFWTGAPSQAFFVGWDGETYTHCSYNPSEPTKLLVQFDDHHLPIGDLKFQIAYHFTVDDFPNDTEDEVINPANITTEIDGQEYQVMLDFTGETAPEIQFSLPAYANEAQRIANEQQRIAAEEQRITDEQMRISHEETRISQEQTRQDNEAQRIRNEQTRINQEESRVREFATLKHDSQEATASANDAAALANQKAQIAADKAQLAADKAALAQDAANLANQKAQLAADKAALANDAAALANEKAALAQQKAEYAKDQGDYAKQQGYYAKEQGDYAKRKGEDAAAQMQQQAQAFSEAQAARQTAYEQAEGTESGSVAGDGSRWGAFKTNEAARDAKVDAKVADITNLQKAVTEGAVYDISANHLTEGVPTKYANLSAALGADGVNVPVDKRKGGMSVKFIQSSDNKYVQFRLMAQDFTTDVTQWQGTINEVKSGSKDLIESGAVYGVTSELETRTGARKTVEGEGFNDNLVTISIPVEAGNSYRVIPQEKTWDVSTVGSSSVVFSIVVENRTIVETRKNAFTSLSDFYDFDVLSGETTAYIYFRAIRYKILKFTVVNKTQARTDYDKNVQLTNLLDTIISLTQTIDEITLAGKDSTRVARNFIVPANTQYYIVPMRNTWPISNVSSGNHVFSVEPVNETNIDILNTSGQQSVTVKDCYKLPVKDEDTTYTLVIRANSGERITICVSCASNESDRAILARIIENFKLQTNASIADHNTKINSILAEKPKYDNNVIDNNVKNTSLFNIPQNRSITGSGATPKTITYGLKGGKSYYLIPKETTWSASTISVSSAVLWIEVNNVEVLGIRKTNSGFVIPELYKIDATVDCNAVVYVRADSGTKVEFLLIEATENINKYLLINTVSSLVESTKKVYENIVFKDYHTFTGASGNIVTYSYPIKEGYEYTVSMNPSIWDVSSLSDSSSVFWFTINGTETAGVRKSSFVGIDDYSFKANADGTLQISLRANIGVKVESIIVDTSKTRLDDIEERIDETDILNLHPKEQVIPVLANFKKAVDGDGHSYGPKNLVLLHFSDLHSEVRPLQRVVKFKNKFSSYIDDTILTGDIVNRQSDDFSFWQNSGAQDILTCIGNHEILVYGEGVPEIGGVKLKEPYLFSGKYCYERYLAPFISSTGITIETDKPYWYKDYSESNIRIIALDYMHWKDTPELVDDTPVTTYPDGGTVDTGQQQTWFVNTLESARILGYSVIVLDHSTPRIGTHLSCTFDSLSPTTLSDHNWREVATAVETFITNGGEFITYLCGHTHVDQLGTVEGHPNQLTMTIDTSRVDLLNGDIKKVHNTNSEDLFNMVCVNTNMKLLTFFRIGSNWDRYGRPITSLVINYQTKSIVWNS